MSFTGSRLNLLELFSYDPFSRAIQTIEEEHFLTHKGNVYLVFGSEIDVPDGASRYWVFRTGARPVHFKRLTIGASEGPVLVSLYEDPTLNGDGDPTTNLRNLNRLLKTKLPLMQVFVDTPPPTDNGTIILGSLYIPANGNNGVTGSTGAMEEMVLEPNNDYLFELVNDPAGAGNADIFVNAVFYEIDYDDDLGDPAPNPQAPYPEPGT